MWSNLSTLRLGSQHHCPHLHCIHRLSLPPSSRPPPLPFDDLGVPPWRPTWHAIQPRTSPHFTPDTKSWSEDFRSAQLHLWEVGLSYSFLWSRRPQLLSPVLSHFHLLYLSEISDSFWCLSLLQPQSFPRQNHYQFNECHLLFFPPSIEHPQAKTPDGWILSSTNMLHSAGENQTMVTTVPSQKGNHSWITNTITYQSYYRPSSLTVTPLKDHHNLYHTTAGTLTIHHNRDC